jgi:hypothetical protein
VALLELKFLNLRRLQPIAPIRPLSLMR